MTVGFGPLARIDGPPPIAPPYGLLQAAAAPAAGVRIVDDVDERGTERWMNGVEVYPYPPDLTDVHDPCAPGSVAASKGFGADLKHPEFGALTLWLAETCTASHVPSQEEYRARVVAAFSAVESAGVAHELLSGARIPANPHLADGNGTFPNADTVTSAINGLALLEGEIAKSGKLGLIHCSPMVATVLAAGRVVDDKKTGVLRTINGIPVIPDFGYVIAGASPTGHTHASGTKEWMYATGPIDVRRSELFTMPETVAEALDRGLGATNGNANAITYRAERYYLVDWDTEIQAAVLIDRCQAGC